MAAKENGFRTKMCQPSGVLLALPTENPQSLARGSIQPFTSELFSVLNSSLLPIVHYRSPSDYLNWEPRLAHSTIQKVFYSLQL